MNKRFFDVVAEVFGEPEDKCPTCHCPKLVPYNLMTNQELTLNLYGGKCWYKCTNCGNMTMRYDKKRK